MTHSMIEEHAAEADRQLTVHSCEMYRRASASSRAKLEERAARSMRAEEMFGFLAEAIDHEFLEIVLGCRGRRLPKDVGL